MILIDGQLYQTRYDHMQREHHAGLGLILSPTAAAPPYRVMQGPGLVGPAWAAGRVHVHVMYIRELE